MMKTYTYISLPGLIIHELMHILMGLISGKLYSFSESYTLWRSDGALTIGLVPTKIKKNTILQIILIPLAPLYFIIGIAILSFFNPIFIGVLIYFAITYIYSFPSQSDFDMIRWAKVYIKYNHSDPTFIRFMNTKTDFAKDQYSKVEISLDDFDLED